MRSLTRMLLVIAVLVVVGVVVVGPYITVRQIERSTSGILSDSQITWTSQARKAASRNSSPRA